MQARNEASKIASNNEDGKEIKRKEWEKESRKNLKPLILHASQLQCELL